MDPQPPEPSTAQLYAFLAEAQGPGEIGRLGGYRILKVLGAGGMGVVFHAEDVQLKRPIALKAMKPAVAENPTSRQRFLREAQAAAAIKHDHIVTIYQVGEDRGVPFLAMEFLAGEPMDQWLARTKQPTVPQILRLGREIALGLAAAHERGLVHRDIKPGNLWLEAPTGRVKLLDFGLAREVSEDVHLTQSGAIVGTPAYMAPEQARGEKIDHRSDLFSLGCVLYRLCTGQMPFTGKNTMAVLSSLAMDTPKPVRELNPAIPAPLSELVMQLLAKKAEERPASAKAVAEQLVALKRSVPNAASADAEGTIDHELSPSRSALPHAGGAPANEETGEAPAANEQTLTHPRRRWQRRWLVAGLAAMLLVGGGLLLPQIIIRIKDKDGRITEIKPPPGAQVEIEKDGKVVKLPNPEPPVKAGPVIAPKIEPIVIEADPLPAFQPGEPLGTTALVSGPAPIKGIHSWTLEARGHRAFLAAAAYSPDGRFLATACADGNLRLWDPESGQLIRVLPSPTGSIYALAWSPDGNTLMASSGDSSVHLWDVSTGNRVRTFLGGSGRVAWSPDGKILATGESGVQLREASSGKLLRRLPTSIQSLAWSPDSRTLATGGSDQMIQLWDIASGKLLQTCKGHDSIVKTVAWSPDGKTLASGSADKTVRLWEAGSGKLLRTLETKGAGGTWVVAWSPDGRSLVSVGASLQLWEASSGQSALEIQFSSETHIVAWSPDGKTLVTGSRNGTAQLWDAKSGKLLRTLQGRSSVLRKLAWSPTGTMLATGSEDRMVRVWEATSGKRLRTLQKHSNLVAAVAWSPDGKMLASSSAEVRLWDGASGQLLRTVPGGRGFLFSLAWSPSGQVLAGGGQDKIVQLWQADSAQLLQTFKGHTADINAVAWSPDGKTLASASIDTTVRLWEAATGNHLRTLAHQSAVSSAAWSPDGRMLASGSNNGTVHFWEADSGKLLRSQQIQVGYVLDLAWSADGKTLFSGYGDRQVRLWEAGTGKLMRSFSTRLPYALSFSWSPDGKTVASAGPDDMIRLNDMANGQPLGVFGFLEHEQDVAISPEGHYRGSPGIEKELVYVVQTERGQETLTPAEFAKKYGWKNDAEKVRLTAQ